MECKFCKSKDLKLFADLGEMPLAGEFLDKKDIGKERKYPLKVYECQGCSLVQLADIVPKELLFQSFLSSVSMKKHFEDYAKEMKDRFLKEGDLVVEIGSNDGVLLEPLKKMGMRVIGIEPVKHIAEIARKKGIHTINDYFSSNVAMNIRGSADMVLANNVFAHIEDLDDVMKGIKIVLKEDGIFVFEVHYLLDLIDKFQYDCIYHEHMYYYSIASLAPFLKKYEFEIFEVKRIPTHSGSIRVYTKQLPRRKIDEFKYQVQNQRKDFVSLLYKLKKEGKKIIGYGAAGRANTLLNYCGINTSLIDYIIDESPLRYNLFTPGSHIPVIPPDKARLKEVDYVVILAWNYKDIIIEKTKKLGFKGKFIMPLPKVEVI